MMTNANTHGTLARGGGLRGLLLRFIRGLEQWRLKTHFKFVDGNLRRADVSHLTPELRAARDKNIALLREYAAHGVFPKNLDFPGQRIPYFKDAYGTPCAVGNLMERTGGQAVVDEITATNNHVYVNDIRGGPAMAWLRRSGLTQAEAAMIQPGYPGDPFCYYDATGDTLRMICDGDRLTMSDPMLAWVAIGATCGVLAFIALEWTKYRLLQSNASWILHVKRLYAGLRPQTANTTRAKLLYASGVNLAAAAVVGALGFGVSLGIASLF